MSSYHSSFDWSKGGFAPGLAKATAGVKSAASLCLFMSEEPAGSTRVLEFLISSSVIRIPTYGQPSRHHLGRGMLYTSDPLKLKQQLRVQSLDVACASAIASKIIVFVAMGCMLNVAYADSTTSSIPRLLEARR
jgi:hypothetical protein